MRILLLAVISLFFTLNVEARINFSPDNSSVLFELLGNKEDINSLSCGIIGENPERAYCLAEFPGFRDCERPPCEFNIRYDGNGALRMLTILQQSHVPRIPPPELREGQSPPRERITRSVGPLNCGDETGVRKCVVVEMENGATPP